MDRVILIKDLSIITTITVASKFKYPLYRLLYAFPGQKWGILGQNRGGVFKSYCLHAGWTFWVIVKKGHGPRRYEFM